MENLLSFIKEPYTVSFKVYHYGRYSYREASPERMAIKLTSFEGLLELSDYIMSSFQVSSVGIR